MADKVAEAMERLEEGVKDMFTSDKFKNYLDVMSKFHNYSANNCILIAMQKPQATYVAGYRDWKKNFNRQVKRGEKGIEIIAPWTQTINIETDKTDENGNIIYEKKQILRYRTVNVFDISQTQGETLPEITSRLTGDVEEYNRFFEAIKNVSDFDIGFEDMSGSKNGYCSHDKKIIRIRNGLSEAHTIKTLVHEVTHEKLHGDRDDSYFIANKSQMEVEAEGTAYVVCSYFGLDTSDYSFGYVTGWAAGKDYDVLKESLTTIRNTAYELIHGIEKEFEQKAELNMPTERQITDAVNEVLNDSVFSGNAVNSYIYSVKEVASVTSDIRIRAVSEYYRFDQTFILKEITTDRLRGLLGQKVSFLFLDSYLIENGIEFEIVEPDEDYTAVFDMDNNVLNIYEDGRIIEKVNVMVELKGEGREDVAFKLINDSNLKIGDTDIAVNPIKEDERLIYEPYLERLEKYENLGYDSSWPMITIAYSNIEDMPHSSLNINEAVKLINRLDDKVYSNPINYVKIKISYVYNDWNYESVQDISFEKGRMNFIDYLELPDNIISYLKQHNSIIEACNLAKNLAPDTTYGQEYFDKMLDWGTYCRMELNHNSDKCILPELPQINEMYNINGLKDWRLER